MQALITLTKSFDSFLPTRNDAAMPGWRRLLVLAGALTALVASGRLAAGTPGKHAGRQLTTLTVATSPIPDLAPPYLGMQKVLFAEQGLAIRPNVLAGAPRVGRARPGSRRARLDRVPASPGIDRARRHEGLR